MSTLDALDRRLADLELALTRLEGNLVDLETDPTSTLVRSSPFEGETAERTTPAFAALDGLWGNAQLVRSAVEDLRSRREGLGLFSGGQAEALHQLLDADLIVFPPVPVPVLHRSLTAPPEARRTASIEAVIAQMVADFAAGRDLIAAIDQTWRHHGPAATALRHRLDTLRRLVPGPLPGFTAAILHLDEELRRTQSAVAADPLGASPALDGIDARVTALDVELRRVVALYAEVTAELSRGTERLDAITSGIRNGVSVHAQLAHAIEGAASLVMAPLDEAGLRDAPNSLGPWLQRLHHLSDDGQYDDARRGLVNWHRLADQWEQRTDEVLRSVSAPVERLGELRGLLDALRAKASHVGLGEDTGLADLAARAEAALHRVPCHLDEAQHLVTAFGEALRTTSRPPGGGQP